MNTPTKTDHPGGAQSGQPWRAESDDNEIRIGISTCLLGQKVRFDGGHKRDAYMMDLFGRFVTFVPVCPEVEVGMGIPRETIRLADSPDGVRLVGTRSETDHTSSMRRYSRRRTQELGKEDLSGYVLKKGSPSCGMERVKVYTEGGMPRKNGVGLFAEALLERFPRLPVEEEGRLKDPRLRENFIERVFAYRRLKHLFAGRWRMGDLVRFHTAEKLNLLAHDPVTYREMGRLVAGARKMPRAEVVEGYESLFMTALKKIATTRKNTNVLQHAQGHLKKLLDAEEKAELSGLISDYRAGLVPLVVPVTLLKHHVRRHGVDYLAGQTYFEPHPKELMLRNHV